MTRKINSKANSKSNFKKRVTENNSVEEFAERLAYLLLEQIKYNCQQKLENKKKETKQEEGL